MDISRALTFFLCITLADPLRCAAINNLGVLPTDVNLKYVARVPYSNGEIVLSQNQQEHTEFFFAPFPYLLPEDIQCHDNVFTVRTELKLSIELYSSKVSQSVQNYLYKHHPTLCGNKAASFQCHISLLPIHSIRITQRTAHLNSSQHEYQLDDAWQSAALLPQSMDFRLYPSDKNACDKIRHALIENCHLPDWELEYTLQNEQVLQRELEVTTEHITNTVLYRQMLATVSSAETIILTDKDFNELLDEAIERVTITLRMHGSFIIPTDLQKLREHIKRQLVVQQIELEANSGKLWENLYWAFDSTRPDRLAKVLNCIFRKQANDDDQFIYDHQIAIHTAGIAFTPYDIYPTKSTDQQTPTETDLSEEDENIFVESIKQQQQRKTDSNTYVLVLHTEKNNGMNSMSITEDRSSDTNHKYDINRQTIIDYLHRLSDHVYLDENGSVKPRPIDARLVQLTNLKINRKLFSSTVLVRVQSSVYKLPIRCKLEKSNNDTDATPRIKRKHVRIYENQDAPGNDLLRLNDILSRDECLRECQSNSECVGVAYKSSEKICWLKRSIGGLVEKVDTDTVHIFSTDYGQIYNDLDAPDNDLQTLTQIKTRARCVEECRNNPKCVGVSYKSSDDRCYLKSSISGLVSTVGVDTVALTSIMEFEQVHVNRDAPGNDIKALVAETRAKCVEECFKTSQCVGVAYKPTVGACYLKESIGGLIVSVGVDIVNVVPIEYGQTYTNIDVPNNDIAMLQNISTRQRCIEECQVIPQCVAVAYRSSDHTCFPKQSAGGLVSKIGIDTVFMTSTPEKIQLYENQDASDNDLVELKEIESRVKCINECKKHSRCLGIAYRYSDRSCYLKHTIGSIKNAEGLDLVTIKPTDPFDSPYSELWVDAQDGHVPADAFVAGQERNKAVYIARITIKEGYIIPGKLVRGKKFAEAQYFGVRTSSTYQILINPQSKRTITWKRLSNDCLPNDALLAGKEKRVNLYASRVNRKTGSMLFGKYNVPGNILYCVDDGKEASFNDNNVEILCIT